MADIRLSETSSGRSQKINTGLGSSVITREQGCTITVPKATIYMGDDNFIITFTEEDRMEMESLEGAFLAFAQKAQVMDGASGTDLSKILLPKKSIPKKAVEVPKKAAKKVKSMMSRTPVEEESTEETSDESTE
tara:strand:+ start:490 stop:891 length:402 start_codon:yes stop_codon:yes gene_type:complete